MLASLVFGAVLVVPSAPLPKDTFPAPTGPAPWIVFLKTNPSGQVSLFVYTSQKIKVTKLIAVAVNGQVVNKQVEEEVTRTITSLVTLDSLAASYATAGGTPVPVSEVLKKAEEGIAVLVSADGKPIDKGWLRAAGPASVVLTAAALAGPIAPVPIVPTTTAAPRLALLRTDAEGKVVVACNSNAVDVMGRTGARILVANGAGVQAPGVPAAGGVGATAVAGPTMKRLDEVKFDAFDLAGKPIAREDALTRLKAGGFVLVMGENRAPDPAYLAPFRGELIVLASPELLVGSSTAIQSQPLNIRAVPLVPAVRAVPVAPPVAKPGPAAPPPVAPAVKPAKE